MSREIIIGRQPIFDRNFRVSAYEILYRNTDLTDNAAMTAQVVVNTLIDLGLENVAGSLPVFFNIDEHFLTNEAALTQALPSDLLYFEILETVSPTPAVLDACRRLKDKGYKLALDDAIDVESVRPFIDYLDIIKIDWLDAADPSSIVKEFRHHPVKFLAEKIDSYESMETAKTLNVDYYQGYFFCKPDTVTGTKPPESRMSILRAMQQSMTAASIDEMFDVVSQNVTLSYRLLKYINSAAFGLKREVASIQQALALLGLDNIRRWLTLLTMTSLGENKPPELIRQALWRARFLEAMARQQGANVIDDDFMMGLFSILDALLDCSMHDSLKEINLSAHVHDGLIDLTSPMGKKLALLYAPQYGFIPKMFGRGCQPLRHEM